MVQVSSSSTFDVISDLALPQSVFENKNSILDDFPIEKLFSEISKKKNEIEIKMTMEFTTNDGTWEKCDIADILVEKYILYQKTGKVKFDFSYNYEYNFKDMTQTNKTTGMVRKIRMIEELILDDNENETEKKILDKILNENNEKFDEKSDLYDLIENFCKDTLNGIKITSIKCVNNNIKKMMFALNAKLYKHPFNPRIAFHGTYKYDPETILKNGELQMKFSQDGINGTKYAGSGIYFSQNLHYIDKNYVHKMNNGENKVLLCVVNQGKSYRCDYTNRDNIPYLHMNRNNAPSGFTSIEMTVENKNVVLVSKNDNDVMVSFIITYK